MESPEMVCLEWAIRCDCQELEYDKFKESYYKAFKDNGLEITEWLCSLEKGKEKGKLHWHGYVATKGYILTKIETWTGKFNKSLLNYLPTIKGNSKWMSQVTNFDGYLPYITKELNIYDDYTIDEEQYEKILAKSKAINADKKKSSSLKVYELLDLEKIQQITDFTQQVLEIYENEWNKEPPQPHVMKKHLIYYLKRRADWDNINKLYGFNQIIL